MRRQRQTESSTGEPLSGTSCDSIAGFVLTDMERIGDLLDLYCLSGEPGFSDLVWLIAATPKTVQSELRAYFEEIGDPQLATAARQPDGRLVFARIPNETARGSPTV